MKKSPKVCATICEDCEKVYFGGAHSFLCPECRKRRISDGAKNRELNKLGNTARKKTSKSEVSE